MGAILYKVDLSKTSSMKKEDILYEVTVKKILIPGE